MDTSESYNICEILDCLKLKELFSQFCKFTDSSVCLYDCHSQNIVIGSGLTSACKDYHLANEKSLKYCQKSHDRIINSMSVPNQIFFDECELGLMHAATPVVIKGKTVAIIILGQVFFKKPNHENMIENAKKFGYDEKEYLKAIDKIQVINKQKLKTGVKCISSLVNLMVDIGLAKIESQDSQREAENREAFLQHLIDSIPDIIFHKDLNGKYLTCNQATANLVKTKVEKIKGANDFDLFGTDTAKLFKSHDEEIFKSGQTIHYEDSAIDPDGVKHYFDTLKTPFYSKNKELLGLIGIKRDITDTKTIKSQLEFENEKLNVTLESIDDGVITTDSDDNTILINKIAQRITGWSQKESVGKKINTILKITKRDTGEKVEPITLKKISKAKISDNVYILKSRKGRKHFVEARVSPISSKNKEISGTVYVLRDITSIIEAQDEKEKIETLIQQSQHLQSLGILAGGIAHDFNNLLTSVLGNISLVSLGFGKENEFAAYLKNAEEAVKEASDLTKELLKFAKYDNPKKTITTIEKLIKETAEFVLRDSNSYCVFDIEKNLWATNIDTNQIKQVIENLIVNAVQSMPDQGKITITCSNLQIKNRNEIPGLKPGKYIKTSIKDHGVGISKEELPRIFEPYYSSQGLSNIKGRGLGLAIDYSIIEQHGGIIIAESENKKGSTFTFFLPAANKKNQEKPISNAEKKGKVLAMDDNENILKLTCRLLQKLGYQTVPVKNGKEAIEIFVEAIRSGEPFDAAILDLTIDNGMGAEETMAKLIEINPNIKAVVTSGYSNSPVIRNFKNYGFKAAIQKPYNLQVLSVTMQDVMTNK